MEGSGFTGKPVKFQQCKMEDLPLDAVKCTLYVDNDGVIYFVRDGIEKINNIFL